MELSLNYCGMPLQLVCLFVLISEFSSSQLDVVLFFILSLFLNMTFFAAQTFLLLSLEVSSYYNCEYRLIFFFFFSNHKLIPTMIQSSFVYPLKYFIQQLINSHRLLTKRAGPKFSWFTWFDPVNLFWTF